MAMLCIGWLDKYTGMHTYTHLIERHRGGDSGFREGKKSELWQEHMRLGKMVETVEEKGWRD